MPTLSLSLSILLLAKLCIYIITDLHISPLVSFTLTIAHPSTRWLVEKRRLVITSVRTFGVYCVHKFRQAIIIIVLCFPCICLIRVQAWKGIEGEVTHTMTTTTTTNAVNSVCLDMSLDQLIKRNKSMRRVRRRSRGRGNHRGRGGGGFSRAAAYGRGGPTGGGPFRNRPMKRGGMYSSFRPNPYAAGAAVPSKFTRQASEGVWQHDMFEKVTEITPPFAVRPPGIETGTKLYISNLDDAVSTDDIKELFSEVGDVKQCSLHFDPSGCSKGTAEVVYSRKIDEIAALKRYNNVQLDGKAMKIEFIGSNLVTPTTTMAAQSASTLQVTNGISKRFYEGHDLIQAQAQRPFTVRYVMCKNGRRGRQGLFGIRPWGSQVQGRRQGGQGQALIGRPSTIATKSAADLDAELESYHSDAMQT